MSSSSSTTISEQGLFETNRATDLSYVIQYVREKIARYNARQTDKRAYVKLNTTMHETRGELFGVVDLMRALGNYKTRDDAKYAWHYRKKGVEYLNALMANDLLTQSGECNRKGKQPAACPQETGIVHQMTVGGNSMDFCTITDFLEYVLPHVTGPVATCIRDARRKTATLVATGSAMASALVEANAEAIENASEDVRRIVDQTRKLTEEALIQEAQIPINVMGTRGRKPRLGPPIVYCDVPRGQVFYHRSSLANKISGLVLPRDCKITINISKVGRADDAVFRSNGDYRKDFAYYDTIITTRTLADSIALEGCYKACIRQFRRDHAQEYYDVDGYLSIHQIVPDPGQSKAEAAQRHLTRNALLTNGHLIDKIYTAEVIVKSEPHGADGPSHEVTITYKAVPLDSYLRPTTKAMEQEREKMKRTQLEAMNQAVQTQQQIIETAVLKGSPCQTIEYLQQGLNQMLNAQVKILSVADTTTVEPEEPIVARFIKEMTIPGGAVLLVDLYPAYQTWVNQTIGPGAALDNQHLKRNFIEALKQTNFGNNARYLMHTRVEGRTGGGQQGIQGRSLRAV